MNRDPLAAALTVGTVLFVIGLVWVAGWAIR